MTKKKDCIKKNNWTINFSTYSASIDSWVIIEKESKKRRIIKVFVVVDHRPYTRIDRVAKSVWSVVDGWWTGLNGDDDDDDYCHQPIWFKMKNCMYYL